MAHSTESLSSIHIGGKLAVVIFIFTLLAFTVESELTQYVQTTLNYRQPYFLFYIVHSSFLIIFPLHILFLLLTTQHTLSSLLDALSVAITNHLVPLEPGERKHLAHTRRRFPYKKFAKLTLGLTFGISTPALLWFASVSLSSMTDITAIWNTNAFFAYLISVRLFKLKWEAKRLLAVLLATLGTFAVVYGGASASSPPTVSPPSAPSSIVSNITTSHTSATTNMTTASSITLMKPSAPLIGNLLTLIAAFGYGLYQVMYKIYAALPTDPEHDLVESPVVSRSGSLSRSRSRSISAYEPLSNGQDDDAEDEDSVRHDASLLNEALSSESTPPLPFGLYPNLLTSLLGLLTLLILWVPLPLLHFSGVEPFHLPPSPGALRVWLAISGIAGSGVVFNAGFMVLLGIWGPVVVSVGNLMTIVLVLGVDVLFGPGLQALTAWSLFGSMGIVGAFGVLVWDMLRAGGKR